MVKRKRIALNYQADYDFSAGIVIYIQNLIKGFSMLDDNIQPELLIIHSEKSPIDEIKELKYKYINFYCHRPIGQTILKRIVNKISRIISGKNLIRRYQFPGESTLLYPFVDCDETWHFKNRIYWKPDFQEMYYPNFVSKEELKYVHDYLNIVRTNPNYELVFSSEDSKNDYKKFFSPYTNKLSVLRFVSILPDLPIINLEELLKKYNLPKKYFFVSNQFWPHKNHQLILESIISVRKQFPDVFIVFSGKQSSYRAKDYFSNLEKFIAENKLETNTIFLGFIPRIDQLLLMKNAQAVIQPSLFEGWSTVIEDCKALGQFVIASDLAVNKEQSNRNIFFFERHNANELAKGIIDVIDNKIDRSPYQYSVNIQKFCLDLISIFRLKAQS